MTSGPAKVVAAVVTHNRPELLRTVVDALLSQTTKPDSVLVVDNDSAMHASAVLGDLHKVEVIRQEVNLGGAGGFALAISEAMQRGADWIWLLDDDAVPRNRALEALLEAKVTLIGQVGGLCSAVFESGSLSTIHRRSFCRSVGYERTIAICSYARHLTMIDTGSFVSFLLSAEAVADVGLPDRGLFLGYDDTEYSLRLLASNWSLWLVPGSEVDHLRSSSSRMRASAFGPRHYYNIRNRLYVARTYTTHPVLASLIAVMVGVAVWGTAKKPCSATAMRLFFRAIQDGLRGRLGEMKNV